MVKAITHLACTSLTAQHPLLADIIQLDLIFMTALLFFLLIVPLRKHISSL